MKRLATILLLMAGIVIGCSSSDNNLTELQNPAPDNSSYPYLYSVADTLYMSWISSAYQGNALQYTRYVDQNWSSPHTIIRDSSWFVNWADFPSIVADENGPVAAHWLKKIPGGTYAYNVNISTNMDNKGWSRAFTPHDDSTATEHGFVSMVPWDNNTVLAVWLDGRRTADRSEDDYYNLDNAMTLRGAIIKENGSIEDEFLIDEAVCDCCQTSLVKTENGALVAYRDRTEDEIRDIAVSRFDGKQWSSPQVVHNDNWKIGACPVNGPKLAASESNVILAWHTGADNQPLLKAAVSTDYGETFDAPIDLNRQESLGRVDAAINDGRAYVSWMEKVDDETADLQLASFELADTSATTMNIDQINSSRQTGFPQMEVVGNEIIFAWTDVDSSDDPKVETKKVSLE